MCTEKNPDAESHAQKYVPETYVKTFLLFNTSSAAPHTKQRNSRYVSCPNISSILFSDGHRQSTML